MSDIAEFAEILRLKVVDNDRNSAGLHLARHNGRNDSYLAKRFGYDAVIALRKFASSAPETADVEWTAVLVAFGNFAAAGPALAKLAATSTRERVGVLSAQMIAASGRLTEARNLLAAVVRTNPRCAEARHQLGQILTKQGKHGEALKEHVAAAALEPSDVRYSMALGNAAKHEGDHQQAIVAYTAAIRLEPDFADLVNNRGTAYQALSQAESARQDFRRAIELDPRHLFARLNLGSLLFQEKNYPEAARMFETAIAIAPSNADANYGLGLSLQSQNLHEEAIRSFDAAVICNPLYHKAFFSKGNSLQALDRIEEAIGWYQKAVEANPGYRDAYVNWAVALQELGRHKDVIALLEPVLTNWPDFNEARWNLANSILCFGPSRHGWETYEARHTLASGEKLQSFGLPALGKEDPAGKRIFVQWDQRFGDIIQMLRYIPLLERQAERCVWQVASPLMDLVAASYPEIEITRHGPPEDLNCRLPFTSLPLALRTFCISEIPADVPYLRPSDQAIEKWLLERRTGEYLVGLVWRGRPKPRGRSIALEPLLPVLHRKGVRIVSLQTECTAEERSLLAESGTIQCGDRLASFDDTAALISQLDVVISVDTAVSHLAGALGKRLWVMLKSGGDWRWLLDRSDNPWYPTARLYRQSRLRDWSNVIAEIDHDLSRLMETLASE